MGALDISVEELLESAQHEVAATEAQKAPFADSKNDNRHHDSRLPERPRSRRSGTADRDDAGEGSDKSSANGSARSVRSKRRSPDYRGPRRSSRERRRGDNYRSSGGDFYRGGGGRPRSHTPSDDGRHWRPSSDRSRRGDDDRRRRGDRERDRPAPRDDRRERDYHRVSPRRVRTPEPTDDERDRRTVFVQQLAARLRTKELEVFFSKIGPVKEAQIVKDRVSLRSKGVGYVEFKDEESVQKAMSLTGQKLLGIPVIVQLTEAEKNRQARVADGAPTQSNGIPFHRLYVGNIHFSVTEEDLRTVFSPFGELEFVQLQREDVGGRSKGYGFVQYVDPTHAKAALQEMNGIDIAGRPIRVGLGSDKFTPESTANLLHRFTNQPHAFQGSAFSGSGGKGPHAGGKNHFDRAGGREEKGAGGASALDDADVGGVNFSNYSRDSLMKKLARTEDPTPPTQPTTIRQRADPKKASTYGSAPSRCIVVKNAYNEADETEPTWVKDLEDDFRDECTVKYGKVVHIGLFRDSQDGEIYVKFADLVGGDNALKGLNGRYFGGRTLTAQPVVDAVYNMNFPKAANL